MKVGFVPYNRALSLIPSPTIDEIIGVLKKLPVYCCADYKRQNKAQSKKNHDVIPSLYATHLDKVLSELGWQIQPFAYTHYADRLDYAKEWSGCRVIIEDQRGNFSRGDSDNRKIVDSITNKLYDCGVIIAPSRRLSNRMSDNINHSERCLLRFEKSPPHVPLLLISYDYDETTPVIDIRQTGFGDDPRTLTKSEKNRYRLVNGVLNDTPLNLISSSSDTGDMPEKPHRPNRRMRPVTQFYFV